MEQLLTLKVFQTEQVLMLLKLLLIALAMYLNPKLMLLVIRNQMLELTPKPFGLVNSKELTLTLMPYKLELVTPLLTLGPNHSPPPKNTTSTTSTVTLNF